MGNRDKRGREKKKPKKQEIKRPSAPVWRAPEPKPVAPSTPPTTPGPTEGT